jgi:hypothetical protein
MKDTRNQTASAARRAISFQCPHCKDTVTIKWLKVGEFAKCKKCGKSSEVPGSATQVVSDVMSPSDGTVLGISYAETGPQVAPKRPTPIFFPVSPFKLLAMSFCTFSFYQFYWFYKNWSLIRAREMSDIEPFWRTFFCTLFCYSCFRRIHREAVLLNFTPRVAAEWLALGWISFQFMLNLPDPYSLLAVFGFLPLLYVQSIANAVNRKRVPGHDPNTGFSACNLSG